ncbi:hypothetical protein Ae201684P_019448 [Aphanomyces euteiches]|uniref:START domain-containing protein n=1 Tax=Aphanomyces euteiches TaxID=100861 RepID=A0A6G0WBU4_9STRA|nr:hypothetical protein Ae201684_016623 [Aphanomyces euteiches]KAH9078358.1 hypothetical protein Ae201684P_019448 [Aphanomyces euteiches]
MLSRPSQSSGIAAHKLLQSWLHLETDVPGQLEVTHHYQMDFRGQLPHWALRAAMKVRLKNIRDVDRYLCEKRLSNTSFLPTTELIPTAN